MLNSGNFPYPPVSFVPDDIDVYLRAVERQVLCNALELYRFNRTKAGMHMGLSLRQMRYRMQVHGIHVGTDSDEDTAPTEKRHPDPDRLAVVRPHVPQNVTVSGGKVWITAWHTFRSWMRARWRR